MSFKQSTKTHDDQLLQLPRDMDQDKDSSYNCAEQFTGGWWYNRAACMFAHPTGKSRPTQASGWEYMMYYFGGERGESDASFEEAEFLLVPK